MVNSSLAKVSIAMELAVTASGMERMDVIMIGSGVVGSGFGGGS